MAELTGGKTIVCDNGTGFLKIGEQAQNFPSHSFPTMVGRPVLRSEERMAEIQLKDIMVGEECEIARSNLEITYPIRNGKVTDWEDMCRLWDHAFTDLLQVDPKTSQLLITEAPMNPKENREKMVQTMFEHYEWQQLNIQVQAVLVLYSQGRQTGLVVDSGDGVTHVVPVLESYVLSNCVERLDLAGHHLTSRLSDLMVSSGYSFNKSSDAETVRQIKDKYCYCALDPEKEAKLCQDTTSQIERFTLPDGRSISINEQRWRCPEALFDPTIVGHDALPCGGGIAGVAFQAIRKCPLDNQKDMYGNIVLSGGTTMFPGLPTRMKRELENIYIKEVRKGAEMNMKIDILAPPGRKHLVFQGGSVLAGITKDTPDWWITLAEYEEEGSAVLHRKCPLMNA